MPDTFKNSFKVEDKEMVSLSVYNVGFQKCEPLYQWGPGIRDHYLIHHIISGKGCYLADSKRYELSAGDTFLVYPYTEVTYYADEKEPWEYYWVGFAGSDASTMLKSTDFSKQQPVIYSQKPSGDLPASENVLKELILKIYEARGSSLSNIVEMTGHLYSVLAYFIKTSSVSAKRQDSYLSYTKKGIEYITCHYSYPITVEDIAEYVGISRSHLFRSFQTCISKSPKEYLSSYRIKQACLLLKQSDLSITAIAKSVGFVNNLYFSKAFHKLKGISPSEYARKNKQKTSLLEEKEEN